MVQIKPFAGLVYNKKIVTDFSKVVTQPYDKISQTLQKDYYNRSPYNIIRIEKNTAEIEGDSYKTAKHFLDQWRQEEVLSPVTKPAYFYLEQTFPFDGGTYTRHALIAMGRLYDYKEGVIFPHEQTLRGPKVDRMELLKATQINLGQLFMLYDDPQNIVNKLLEEAAAKTTPFFNFVDDEGITQKLSILEDPALCAAVSQCLQDKKLYIADGHHRYETALAYSRDEAQRTGKKGADEPFNFAMMSLVSTSDPGLKILPTHRVLNHKLNGNYDELLKRLEKEFVVKAQPYSENDIVSRLDKLPDNSFFFYRHDKPDKLYSITAKAISFPESVKPSLRDLDVYILHQRILGPLLGITADDLANNTFITYKRDPR